jgi:hypothetical protein
MLGGRRNASYSKERLVGNVKELGFTQHKNNFFTEWASQQSSTLRSCMTTKDRFRHVTTGVNTCSGKPVPSLLTRSHNFLNTEIQYLSLNRKL